MEPNPRQSQHGGRAAVRAPYACPTQACTGCARRASRGCGRSQSRAGSSPAARCAVSLWHLPANPIGGSEGLEQKGEWGRGSLEKNVRGPRIAKKNSPSSAVVPHPLPSSFLKSRPSLSLFLPHPDTKARCRLAMVRARCTPSPAQQPDDGWGQRAKMQRPSSFFRKKMHFRCIHLSGRNARPEPL